MQNRIAWRVTARGTVGIVAATTRGRAVAHMIRTAAEVDWVFRWADVKAVRASQYDAWAADMPRDVGWDEQFVKTYKQVPATEDR